MVAMDKINSNHTLATSVILYSLLFRVTTPANASAIRRAISREGISVTHSTFVTLAAAFELYGHYDKWASPSVQSVTSSKVGNAGSSTRKSSYADLDIISFRSPFGNALVAYECGYLIQDFVVLVLTARLARGDARSQSIMAKNINWRVLGWHHLGVAAALGLFHWRALHGQAKGVLLVLMLFLMNFSYVSVIPFKVLRQRLRQSFEHKFSTRS